MGSIKSTAIKRFGDELISKYGSRFSTDFEKNKQVLMEIKNIQSKKARNILAGYITRKMKQIEKTGI